MSARPPTGDTWPENADTWLQHGDAQEGDSAIAPPIHLSATFRAADAAGFADMASRPRHPRYYTRYGNPTTERVAGLIAGLEGAPAGLMTASGMGAISAAVLAMVSAGDHVVAQTNHYMGTSRLLGDLLVRMGVAVSFVDQTDVSAFEQAIRPQTRLIVLETPVNPTLALTDLAAVADLARRRGIRTLADNTFACPLNQQPRRFGIDLVVHSATKYLGGHHDLTAGVVLGDADLIEQVWNTSIMLGAVLSPQDAWLLLRGLRTLSVRVERINASALRLAHALAAMPDVAAVHYPGLPSHPQHDLARRQMSGFGGVMAVQVRGGYRGAEAVMKRLRLFAQAVSLGGVESLAVHAAAMWAGSLEPDLIRLSVGLERVEDLMADLGQALAPPG
ncbi:MAG: aminotransferase class I/II-fold pyridoxal phosphate-dependent enzyme [Burkholderiales bacterium]|nr:aminotransferase class I/II-fold pyridoxal phosphate-dependent enzyme [Burkholderiales bacterium]